MIVLANAPLKRPAKNRMSITEDEEHRSLDTRNKAIPYSDLAMLMTKHSSSGERAAAPAKRLGRTSSEQKVFCFFHFDHHLFCGPVLCPGSPSLRGGRGSDLWIFECGQRLEIVGSRQNWIAGLIYGNTDFYSPERDALFRLHDGPADAIMAALGLSDDDQEPAPFV